MFCDNDKLNIQRNFCIRVVLHNLGCNLLQTTLYCKPLYSAKYIVVFMTEKNRAKQKRAGSLPGNSKRWSELVFYRYFARWMRPSHGGQSEYLRGGCLRDNPLPKKEVLK